MEVKKAVLEAVEKRLAVIEAKLLGGESPGDRDVRELEFLCKLVELREGLRIQRLTVSDEEAAAVRWELARNEPKDDACGSG